MLKGNGRAELGKSMSAAAPTSTAAYTLLCAVSKLEAINSSDEFRNKAMISFQKKVEVITIQDFILQS